MGKKRNRRNKSNKNSLPNSFNENQSCSTSDHDVRENKGNKNNNSIASKNAPNHETPRFKSNSGNLNSIKNSSQPNLSSTNKNQFLLSGNAATLLKDCDSNTGNVYPEIRRDKSVDCEKIACTTDDTLKKENQKSSFTDMQGAKPKTLFPYEITETKFSSKPLFKNICYFDDDDGDDNDDYSLSLHKERVKPNHDVQSWSDNNRSTSSRYITHEHLESDYDYPTSEFLLSMSNDLQRNKNKKTTDDNFGGVDDIYNLRPLNTYLSYADSSDFASSVEYCDYDNPTSESFLSMCNDLQRNKNKKTTDDNFSEADDIYNLRPLNANLPEAGSSDFGSSVEYCDYEFNKLRGTMTSHVDMYENSKDSFKNIFHIWLPERKNTIQKLKALYSEIHDLQLNYNKSQVALRELSCGSRSLKKPEFQALNFFASFTAFLSDAASGVVSAVQAINVESYQKKFQEIIDQDAEVTQRLYKARSQYVAKYHNIEEVMKKFQFETFSSTVGKISNTLEVGKYWEAMKYAYQEDNMPQLLDVVGKFFDNATQSTKLEEISGSIQTYTDDNPAAKDACKFAGRATYGALDTVGINHSRNAAFRGIDFAANGLLMLQDQVELDRLRCSVNDENSSQSKLEAQIDEAINSLELEIKEMNDIYEELFKFNFYGDDEDKYKNNFVEVKIQSMFYDSDDDYYDESDYRHDNW